jgi:UDP-N-acetyl-D-mannosaminuronic acid dehydrogenase
MPFQGEGFTPANWRIHKIGVIGPGIVGMPMAALLARAARDGAFEADARVVVVQRRSETSGWKVDAINAGKSPIGGVEPDLEAIIAECAAAGRLSASDDYTHLSDCDLVLVCVQTDKAGLVPDYGPLDGALDLLARHLANRPAGNVPVVAIESTLAPSSMTTVVREHFRRHGLEEGRDVLLLGNSPNRVMPGRLIERVAAADKLIGGLSAETPTLIESVYRHIVTQGTLHTTTSMTAEVVKTLENAYRDVRIAFAAEVVRHCDAQGIDFFALRDAVNARAERGDDASGDAAAVPVGALLVPTVGVGGHCLPKDGILLRWRYNARFPDRITESLIHRARVINDASPAYTIALAERTFGPIDGRTVAVLGAAYRGDSDDTRNAPALSLCRQTARPRLSGHAARPVRAPRRPEPAPNPPGRALHAGPRRGPRRRGARVRLPGASALSRRPGRLCSPGASGASWTAATCTPRRRWPPPASDTPASAAGRRHRRPASQKTCSRRSGPWSAASPRSSAT